MSQQNELSMEGLRKRLEESDIHPSYQRLKIMEYLMENRIHPTVDTIHKDLSLEMPTLSKTTIYNTLSLLRKKGLVAALTISEHELMYDSNTVPHAHFKCSNCGSLYDVDMEPSWFGRKFIEGHKIIEYGVYLKGICKNCLKQTTL